MIPYHEKSIALPLLPEINNEYNVWLRMDTVLHQILIFSISSMVIRSLVRS
jgi:hypothetical protein